MRKLDDSIARRLCHFERNKIWSLVPKPTNNPIIDTKWVFRKKLDKLGNVVKNKAMW
ncbi:Uncharacterized protein TCM_039237 [Theobroma cacao]|uniref:Reverse transcriptase Ty1/copia-type domain-containing protein n=1 Tax=Theobroma cacao TaxID=3641 RepID=A0A061GQV1_THECC|nr:Uncharacterized protein TCM_039237 [Theobroma cacao]